ncbi:MAG TPA: DNA recombination protein RmuC, partial [Rhodobacteraceae bacterium]|nr:DNA recombination protein RmuC [Paracoccaceae bacterium]
MNDMFADLWLYVMAAGVVAVLLLFILLIVVVRRAGRSVKMIEPLGQQMGFLGQRVQELGEGQSQLAGGLQTVSQTQTVAQAQLMNTLEQRLAEVQAKMADSLHGSTVKTTRSLTELQERLATIDKAQENIE